MERLGKYVLKSKLGQGGMGTVFLAVQEGLNREVAVKVLPEERIGKSPELLKRFMREASVCARLSHPNIIKVFDYGFEQGFYYYTMEVLKVRNLEDVIKEQPIQPVEFTLRIARQMAEAFSYYHPQGIIHRDIKPANILLASENTAILTDFGLVKDLEASGITRAGVAVGTPYYMAPEMVRGLVVGAGADIYGLGVILYRMLTGRFPFRGQGSAEVFQQIIHAEAEPPSRINPAISQSVENLVLNCLEKDPRVRYSSGDELTRDLAAAQRRQRVSLRRSGAAHPAAEGPAGVALGTGGQTTGPIRVTSGQPASAGGGESARLPRPSRALTSALPGRDQGTVPTQPIVVPASAPMIERALWGLLLLPVVAGLLFLVFRMMKPGYEATDVVLRTGANRARIEWQSPGEYVGQVEWGIDKGDTRVVASESSPVRKHLLVLKPLELEKPYVAHILLPDGTRSLEYRFQARSQELMVRSLQVGRDSLTLVLDSADPIVVVLKTGGRTVQDPAPSTGHRLSLDSCRPLEEPLELTFADALGDEQTLDRVGLVALLRKELLPGVVGELCSSLEDYDPTAFIRDNIDNRLPEKVCTGALSLLHASGMQAVLEGKTRGKKGMYRAFSQGDGRAREFGAALAAHFDQQPFLPALRSFLFLGKGVLDQHLLSSDQELRLLKALRPLLGLDFYAALTGLPFSTGLEGVMERDYRVRPFAQLHPREAPLERTVSLDVPWAYPYSEYQSIYSLSLGSRDRLKLLGEFDWKFVLPNPGTWKRAELLLLGVELDSELCYEATLNGKLVLEYRDSTPMNEDGARPPSPVLSIAFDPRHLQPGNNRIQIRMSAAPGTRYLGLRRASMLRAVRLAWE